jgi:hypothetical protein
MSPDTTNLSVNTLRPGDKLDKFEVVRQIGVGGMGTVWQGYDRLLDRAVAIKQVTIRSESPQEQEEYLERFRREVETQKRVAQAHKNLVKVYECVQDPRGLFLVMEYVDGPTLGQYLEAHPEALDARQVLGIVGGAAMALEALHREGVVHRDLTPANILLPTAGGLKVCDFGLAALLDQQDAQALGSARYMAPESFGGQPVDGRADIYSLGMIAYEMLAGKAAFAEAFKVVLRDTRNQALRWMKWHTNARASAPALSKLHPQTPKKLSDLVARMMEKDPAQRISSADELLGAIRRHFAGTPESDADGAALAQDRAGARGVVAPAEPTARLARRSRLPLYLSLSGAGLLVLIAVVALVRSSQQAEKYRQARDAAVAELNDAKTKQDQADNASINAGHELTAQEAAFESAAYQAAAGHFTKLGRAWTSREPALLGKPSQAHLLWCQAMVKMLAKDYGGAKDLFVACDDLGVLPRNPIQLRIGAAANRIAVADQLAGIVKLKDTGKFHDARAALEDLLGHKELLLDSERDKAQAIASEIDGAERKGEIDAVLRAAGDRYSRGERPQAIKDLVTANTRAPHERYTQQINAWNHAMLVESDSNNLAAAEKENRYDDAMALIKQLRSLLTPKELADLNQQVGQTLDQRERALQVRQLKGDAQQLTDAGKTEDAAGKWAQVLALVPNDPDAKHAIGSIDDNKKFHELVAMGDAARDAHNWPDALAKYHDALKVHADADVAAKIDACEIEQALQRGLDLMANNQCELARPFFQLVLDRKPDHDVAKKNMAEIDRRKDIEDRIAHADLLVKTGQPSEAATLLAKLAPELRGTDDGYKQQVKQRRDDIDYGSWLRKSRQAIAAGDWKSAAQYLLTLQSMPNGNTPEVAKLWEQVKPHVQQAPPPDAP